MGPKTYSLWLLALWVALFVVHDERGWAQDKPPIQLPEVVIVGQDERVVQEEKGLLQPDTMPIGLKGEFEVGKIAQLAPPVTGDFAGPAAENPGCLIFPRVQGARDEWLYRRGINQVNNANYTEALTLFARLLHEFPTSNYRGAAAFWSGESAYRQGQEDAALQFYEQVITMYHREPLRDYALFRAAQLRLTRREYPQAMAHLDDLLSMYPASPTTEPALYLFGESAFRLGQYQRAMQSLDTFLRRFPQSSLRERADLWQAESLYQLRRYQEAQTSYQAFLQRYASSPHAREARYGLGWAMLKAGNADLARQVFVELAQQHREPRYAETVDYATIAVAMQRGDLTTAQRQWELMQQRFPDGILTVATLGELAWEHFAHKHYADALTLYRQLLHRQQTPERLRDVAQYMVGECLYQQADYPAALQAFRQVRAEAELPLLEKAAFRLGLALYHMREYTQAIQVLQAFMVRYAASPYRDEALFWLAEARFQQQEYRAALEDYGRLPRDSRLYDYGLYGRGWVHIREQQWSQAIEVFQQLVDELPQSVLRADALYRIAESQQNLGQQTKARQSYERYLEAYPKDTLVPAARLQLALLSMRADRFDEAIQALRQVQQQFKNTEHAAEAQYWLGMAFFRREQFGEAREVFQDLVRTAPEHPRAAVALLRVADAYYNEKRFREGLIAYEKVGILYPQSSLVADARYGAILSHYQMQQFAQFLRAARAFVGEFAQHPLSGPLLVQMAEYYQEHKQPEEAIQTYTRLVQGYPQSALADKALLRLGELYMEIGQPQRAVTTYDRILQNGQAAELKPDALLGQGKAYEALGDIDTAIQQYRRIAEQYPESALAAPGLYRTGRLLLAQHHYEEAQHQFEAVVQQYPTDPIRFASLLQVGMIELHLRHPERAIAVLQQAQQAPDVQLAAQVQFQLGRAYALAGDLQQSINAYLRVAYLYPDEATLVAQSLQQAARQYVEIGKCAEALTVYTKLLDRTAKAQEAQAIQQEIERSGCR